MEWQIFLHGAATYPKSLLCPEDWNGVDTNETDDFSEKKNLSLQKNPTGPTKYTSYSACLRVLKEDKNTWKQSVKYLRVGTAK